MTIQNVPFGDIKSPSNQLYKKVNKTDTNTAKTSASFSDQYKKAISNQKTDTIELSSRNPKPTLSQIRDSIVSDISKDKDANVIDDLRSKLESGQYSIDSQDLASCLIFAENDQN